MSLIHPVKKVYITQVWGVNPNVYARFGLKGHNGVDYRVFNEAGNRATTGPIYAAHNGVVVEALYDVNGYGYYLKIENDSEGSIYGHLEKDSWEKVGVGNYYDQGDYICHANNSGFSTGAHLHWGYYPKPRNRSNGYSGTIDPLPLIKNDNEASMPSKGIYYEDIEGFGPIDFGDETQVKAFINEFQENRKRIDSARDERDNYKSQLDVYKSEYEKEMKDIRAKMASLEEAAKEYKDRYKRYVTKVSQKLDTTQDEPAQMAELTRLVVVEDELSKLETKCSFLSEEVETKDEAIRRLKETLKDTQEELKVAKGLLDATDQDISREYWRRKAEFLTDFIKTLKNILGGK